MDNSSNAIPYLNKGMSGKVIPETLTSLTRENIAYIAYIFHPDRKG